MSRHKFKLKRVSKGKQWQVDLDLQAIVPLRETPFPGDTIRLHDGRVLRVLRREFQELSADADDNIDVKLGVRLA